MLRIKCFHFNALETCCTLLYAEGGSRCIICDPSMGDSSETETLLRYLAQNALTPEAILLTHGHFDHICGVVPLLRAYPGIPVYMHPAEQRNLRLAPAYASLFNRMDIDGNFPTVDLSGGETLHLAGADIQVLFTPGHAPGGVCYYIESEKLLLCGDVLFAGSIGRSDLPGGDYDTLMQTLLHTVMVLPDDTDVIPGHGPVTTIGSEAMTNPFLLPFNEPED